MDQTPELANHAIYEVFCKSQRKLSGKSAENQRKISGAEIQMFFEISREFSVIFGQRLHWAPLGSPGLPWAPLGSRGLPWAP